MDDTVYRGNVNECLPTQLLSFETNSSTSTTKQMPSTTRDDEEAKKADRILFINTGICWCSVFWLIIGVASSYLLEMTVAKEEIIADIIEGSCRYTELRLVAPEGGIKIVGNKWLLDCVQIEGRKEMIDSPIESEQTLNTLILDFVKIERRFEI